MAKKAKWLIAVLAVLCCLSFGLFAACTDDPAHTHSYTEWRYDDEQHWKVCPDDDAIDENSYGEHVLVAGECECGYKAPQEEPAVYGSVTGKIILCTIGEISTDYAGVNIDLGDDNVTVDLDAETGEFTVSDVEVGKTYTLTIGKTGYSDYTGTILVEEEGQTVDLNDVILEGSGVFVTRSQWAGWYPSVWGHTGTDGHYFISSDNTVAVQSVKGYDQVAVTLTVSRENTTNAEGIWMVFEDGSVCPISIYQGDSRIEWDLNGSYGPGGWNIEGMQNNHFANVRNGMWNVVDGYGNQNYSSSAVSQEIKDKYDDGTLELTLVRDGADFYLYIDGVLGEKTTIEAEYAEQPVYIGFYAKDVTKNNYWAYEVETDISAYVGAASLTLNKTGEGEVSYDTSEEYAIMDFVDISLQAETGYHFTSLTVNGQDRTSEVVIDESGAGTFRYWINCTRPQIDVVFAQDVLVDVTFNITGVKYGVEGNSIADGTTVALLGRGGLADAQGTVDDGKVTFADDIIAGTYTLSVDGYFTQEITVGEDGSVPDVTLEWEVLENIIVGAAAELGWPAAIYDFTNVNQGSFVFSNTWGIGLLSKENFTDDIAVSWLSKKGNHANKEFVTILFEDGSFVAISSCGSGDDFRIEYLPAGSSLGWGSDNPYKTNITKNSWNMSNAFGQELYSINNTSAELAALKAKWEGDGFDLNLVKKDNSIYVFADDTFIDSFTIDAKYADMSFRFGYVVWDPTSSYTYNYGYTTDVSSFFVPLTMTGKAENGSVTFDKDSYVYGETATVTVTPSEGYMPTSVKVNGHEMIGSVSGGKFTVRVDAAYTVEAAFAKIEYTDIELSVTGAKYGVSGNSIADGTKVILRNSYFADVECIVANGKISVDGLPCGDYTAVVEGYNAISFTAEETGASVTGLSFEYALFGTLANLDWEKHDLTNVNKENASILYKGPGGTFNVLTNDTYENVSATLRIDWNNSKNNMHTQGIILVFENNKHLIVRYHNGDTNGNIQYANAAWDPYNAANSLFDESADLNQWGENPVHELTEEERAEITTGEGIDLTVRLGEGKLYTYFGGVLAATYELPAEYAEQDARVGFFSWDTADNVTMYFTIMETEEAAEVPVQIAVEKPESLTEANVTAEKETYYVGDSVVLNVSVPAGSKLVSLTVNGTERRKEVSGGKLTFVALAETTVKAVFEAVDLADVTIGITGAKYGVDGNSIADGTKVVLKNDYFADIEATVTDGKIVLNDLPADTFTLTADGYLSQKIVIEKDTVALDVALQYDLFENLTLAWGWGDNSDLSKQNEGSITHKNGDTQWISSKDSYQNVAITATVVTDGQRQGVFIRFAGASYANDGYMMIQKEWDSHVSWNGETNIWGNGSNLCGDWTGYVNPLSDADKALIAAGEYELTLVRDANKIHVFINGAYYDTKVLDESYAELECYVGIYCTSASKIIDKERTFRIEDASVYLKDVVIKDETASDANGSLIVTEGAKISDTVTVTVNADSGYRLASLSVDGTEIDLGSIAGGQYTFRAVKAEYTLKATFEAVALADVTIDIAGAKYGVDGSSIADGTKIVLKNNLFADIEATVADGKIVLTDIAAGEYSLIADGYVPYALTVTQDAELDVTLQWDMFMDGSGGDYPLSLYDFTNVNKGEFVYGNSWGIGLLSNEQFTGDIAVSWLSKKGNHTQKEFATILFEDGSFVAISSCGTGDDFRIEYLPAGQGLGWGSDNPYKTNITKNSWNPSNAFGQELYSTNNTSAELAALKAKWEGDGFDLNLVKKGNTIYFFADDTFIDCFTIDAKYADMSFRFGYVVWNPAQSYTFGYGYTTDVSSFFVPLTMTVKAENGSVAFDKDSYVYGETATVTVTPNAGYAPTSVKVNGHEMTGSVSGGKFTVRVDAAYTVEAAFAEVGSADIELPVTGAKYGVSGNSIADGTKVILRNSYFADVECIVADGKISANGLPCGDYTAVVEGYNAIPFTVEKAGASVTGLPFEYALFGSLVNWDWDKHDFTNVNKEDASILYKGPGGTFNVLTNDTYENVSATLRINWNNSKHNMHTQGIILVFENNKHLIVRYHNGDGNGNIQYANAAWDPYNAANTLFDSSANLNQWGENPVYNLTDEEREEITTGEGIDLTVTIRGGKLYTYFGGVQVAEYTIPAEYAAQGVRVGFFSWDTADNVTVYFALSEGEAAAE